MLGGRFGRRLVGIRVMDFSVKVPVPQRLIRLL